MLPLLVKKKHLCAENRTTIAFLHLSLAAFFKITLLVGLCLGIHLGTENIHFVQMLLQFV